MTDKPASLRSSPNIPWENQTLEQLRAERDYWIKAVENAAGFASAKAADDFRQACERWIERREREAATRPPQAAHPVQQIDRDALIRHVAEAQFDAIRRVPDGLEWETCPQPIRDAYITGTTAAFAAIEAAGYVLVVAESIPSSLVNYIDKV